MLKKTTNAFTSLIFILFVLLLTCDHITAQNNSSLSPLDSLRKKFNSKEIDTSGLKTLVSLSSGLIYENPDTAVSVCKLTIQSALQVIDKSNQTNNTEVKNFAIRSIAVAYNNLGISYEFKADYPISLWYHSRSLDIRNKLGDTLGVGMSYNNIGIVYDSQGEYIQALNYYLKSSQCFVAIKDIMRVASSYCNIGIIYYRLGEQQNALDYYFKSLWLFNHIKNYSNNAQIYTNIAISYTELKDYKKALEYNFKSLKIEQEKEIQNEYNTVIVYTNIGSIYRILDNDTLAEKYVKLALEINERLGLLYGVSSNYSELGVIAYDRKDIPTAEKYSKMSLKIGEEIGALDLMENQNNILSQIYEKTGQFEKSLYHQKEYHRLNILIFNSEKSKEMGRIEAVHEMKETERKKLEKEADDLKTKQELRRRKNLLQYSGIIVILFIIALTVTFMGVIKVKPVVASGVSFFAFLLFFEFLLLLFDPAIDGLSKGEPAYKLMLNAAVALAIFPVHSFFDRLLRKRITKQKPPISSPSNPDF